MPRPPVIANLSVALLNRAFPTVMVWNRLEGRPRTTEFDRALQADIHDPLWMLARQWQLGEFRGEDGGSPVTATFHVRTTRPTRYQAQDSPPTDVPDQQPLETLAEGRAVPFTIGPDLVSLDLRLAMGRRWMKLMSPLPAAVRAKIMARWTVSAPDPASDADVPLVAHPEVWAMLQAVAGRTLDGYELYQHLKAGGHPYDGVDGVTVQQQHLLDGLTASFTGWFGDLIAQPSGPEAFDTARLEHRFTVAVPEPTGETVLSAPAFAGGVLDWHAFSYDTTGTSLGAAGGTPAAPGFFGLRAAAQHTLVQRYIAANRGLEALNPAENAAADYRALADTPGADKVQIAQTLLDLCDEIAPVVDVSGPAVVVEAAVAVLRDVTPAPGDADFLRLRAGAEHNLVQRYIAASSAPEALNPAEEAATDYRALADTPGADKVQIVQTLLDLCDEIAAPVVHPSGAAFVAETAVDVLTEVTPAPGDADFLRVHARALDALIRALIAVGRTGDALNQVPAAIQAYVSLAAVAGAQPVIAALQNLSDTLASASASASPAAAAAAAAAAADARQAASRLREGGAPAPGVASAPDAAPASDAARASDAAPVRHGLAATAPATTAPAEGAAGGADPSTEAEQVAEAALHDSILPMAQRLMDLSAQLAPIPGLASQAANIQQDAVNVLERMASPVSTVTRTVVPGEVRYPGMPNPRWWAFEDGRTDFGAVTPDTTDLVKLLFLEFALVYSNDWFLLPCDLDAGALALVDGVVFTDVFGQRTWIEPAGTGADDDWQRWSMYNLDVSGTAPAAARLGLFLPSAPDTAQGPPVEDVLMVRDEAANMVWGIERTVWLATGAPLPGAEAARETLAYRARRQQPPVPAGPAASPAAIAYQVTSTVPENWIPFIPVHVTGDLREIKLQRGAMPRIMNGTITKVQPRTTLLRPGLDAAQPYFVHEEEVPRVGTRLSVAFNRTRWQDGRVVVWLGARRATGRGEASSGLDWDRITDTLGGFDPSLAITAEYLIFLAGQLHQRIVQLLGDHQRGPAAALVPATLDAYRQYAASTGADILGAASGLATLAAQLNSAGLQSEAAQVSEAAAAIDPG